MCRKGILGKAFLWKNVLGQYRVQSDILVLANISWLSELYLIKYFDFSDFSVNDILPNFAHSMFSFSPYK